jgi:ABC-type nickel/cobalt efflux system permease component RcnA
MSDDPPRPASGQQPDPRPTAGAPAWWGALGRPDLPIDGAHRSAPRPAPAAHAPASAGTTGRRMSRWRMWAFNVVVLAIAVLIVCVGLGVLSLSMFLTVALLFGVPLGVAAITTTVVARRSR